MTSIITLVLRIESEFLEREVEKSAQLIIQVLDNTSDDPENLWDDLEWLGLFNTDRMKTNLCDFTSLFIKVEQENIK